MIWKRIGPHTLESDAGYCIVRCNSYGIPTGLYVTTLGRTTKTKVATPLERHTSADDAKQYCEVHFQATKASAA